MLSGRAKAGLGTSGWEDTPLLTMVQTTLTAVPEQGGSHAPVHRCLQYSWWFKMSSTYPGQLPNCGVHWPPLIYQAFIPGQEKSSRLCPAKNSL